MKDIISYCYEELDILFDLEKELPYKFIMIKNSEGNYKNIIVFKVDHNLADGLGFIGLITALGENYSLNLFPRSMKKHPLQYVSICYPFFNFLTTSSFPSSSISSFYTQEIIRGVFKDK